MKKEQKLRFKKTNFTVKQLGGLSVEAGVLMIVDPCYSIGLRDDTDKTFDHQIYGKDWDEFCEKFLAADQRLQLPNGIGYCISTPDSDGFHNIYGLFDSDNLDQPKFLLVEL